MASSGGAYHGRAGSATLRHAAGRVAPTSLTGSPAVTGGRRHARLRRQEAPAAARSAQAWTAAPALSPDAVPPSPTGRGGAARGRPARRAPARPWWPPPPSPPRYGPGAGRRQGGVEAARRRRERWPGAARTSASPGRSDRRREPARGGASWATAALSERYETSTVTTSTGSGISTRSTVGDVGRLQVDHPRILAQRTQQLAVAGVDRVDAPCPGLEQDPGEAARRGADVQRHPAGDGDIEGVERGAQLGLPAQAPWRRRRPTRARAATRASGLVTVKPSTSISPEATSGAGHPPGRARRPGRRACGGDGARRLGELPRWR